MSVHCTTKKVKLTFTHPPEIKKNVVAVHSCELADYIEVADELLVGSVLKLVGER